MDFIKDLEKEEEINYHDPTMELFYDSLPK